MRAVIRAGSLAVLLIAIAVGGGSVRAVTPQSDFISHLADGYITAALVNLDGNITDHGLQAALKTTATEELAWLATVSPDLCYKQIYDEYVTAVAYTYVLADLLIQSEYSSVLLVAPASTAAIQKVTADLEGMTC